MKLYHISQDVNNNYDTYSDLVVCAESEDEARNIHPGGSGGWDREFNYCWCQSPDQVKVEYIGEAAAHITKGIICASFHAG